MVRPEMCAYYRLPIHERLSQRGINACLGCLYTRCVLDKVSTVGSIGQKRAPQRRQHKSIINNIKVYSMIKVVVDGTLLAISNIYRRGGKKYAT